MFVVGAEEPNVKAKGPPKPSTGARMEGRIAHLYSSLAFQGGFACHWILSKGFAVRLGSLGIQVLKYPAF